MFAGVLATTLRNYKEVNDSMTVLLSFAHGSYCTNILHSIFDWTSPDLNAS